jgi:hypothetical protein
MLIRRHPVFLVTFFVMALLTKTHPDSAHVYSRLGTVDSLVARGTYQLDDSIFIGTVDKIYRDGHYYSHQPPLLSTLTAPIYAVLHLPGTAFNNRGRLLMTYLFSLFTNGLAFALTAVVFAKIFKLAGVPAPRRYLFAGLLPLGTWLLPYALVPNNHGISGLLLAVLAWLLLQIEWQGMTRFRDITLGGVLGLLIGIELLPIASFVPLTVIYLVTRGDLDLRNWLRFTIGLGLPILAHAIVNVRITGDVIPAGFHHELFNYPGSVFDETSLTGTIKFNSVSGAAGYMWTSLFAGKGFFTFAPLGLLGLVVGMIEWRWWARARGVQLVLLGGSLISLAIALLTTNNFGGEAVGFRHAVYLTPAFLTLLLPWIVDAHSRSTVVKGVAAVSLAVMLMLAVRQPWSTLSLSTTKVGTWDEYVPIVARLVRMDLFKP